MADRLLCLTERSDERPCGAGTQTSRMEESACPGWRLECLAGGWVASGAEEGQGDSSPRLMTVGAV